jgi:hypothetical protein
VTLVDNQVILYPNTVFEAITSFDYRLKKDSVLIDSANPAYAPLFDVTGAARPQGKGPDKGAYEASALVQSPPPEETVVESPPPEETVVESPLVVEPVVKSPKPTAPGKAEKKPRPPKLTDASRAEAKSGGSIKRLIFGLVDKKQKPVRERRFWTDGFSMKNSF